METIIGYVLFYAVPTALILFGLYSVFLFIKDGKKAKRENCGRSPEIIQRFVFGMAILVVAASIACSMLLDSLWPFQYVPLIAVGLYALYAAVRFVKEHRAAKREGRSMDQRTVALFSAAISLVILAAVIFSVLLALAALMMSGM